MCRPVEDTCQGEPSMADVQITCNNRQPHQNPDEGITHLGNLERRWTLQQVIDLIEARTNTYFTLVDGNRADIHVVNGPHGKYLRSHAEGRLDNNLLALP